MGESTIDRKKLIVEVDRPALHVVFFLVHTGVALLQVILPINFSEKGNENHTVTSSSMAYSQSSISPSLEKHISQPVHVGEVKGPPDSAPVSYSPGPPSSSILIHFNPESSQAKIEGSFIPGPPSFSKPALFNPGAPPTKSTALFSPGPPPAPITGALFSPGPPQAVVPGHDKPEAIPAHSVHFMSSPTLATPITEHAPKDISQITESDNYDISLPAVSATDSLSSVALEPSQLSTSPPSAIMARLPNIIDKNDNSTHVTLSEHGRQNVQHAELAAKALGINLNDWNPMKTSELPTECRPHTSVVVCSDWSSESLSNRVTGIIETERFRKKRALLVFGRHAEGCGAIVSSYLNRWALRHDSATDFQKGAARVKLTNKELKNHKLTPPSVGIVIADIDGSHSDPNRRVPIKMLQRESIRFILICSREERGMLNIRRGSDPPW